MYLIDNEYNIFLKALIFDFEPRIELLEAKKCLTTNFA